MFEMEINLAVSNIDNNVALMNSLNVDKTYRYNYTTKYASLAKMLPVQSTLTRLFSRTDGFQKM